MLMPYNEVQEQKDYEKESKAHTPFGVCVFSCGCTLLRNIKINTLSV